MIAIDMCGSHLPRVYSRDVLTSPLLIMNCWRPTKKPCSLLPLRVASITNIAVIATEEVLANLVLNVGLTHVKMNNFNLRNLVVDFSWLAFKFQLVLTFCDVIRFYLSRGLCANDRWPTAV